MNYCTENFLAGYLKKCRWFRSKAKTIKKITLIENIPVGKFRILFLNVHYTDKTSEKYLLPATQDIFANGLIYDAVCDYEFRKTILSAIQKGNTYKGRYGKIVASKGKFLKDTPIIKSQVLKGEQSNTSFIYDDIFIFKLYRKLEAGVNPELEVTKFLTEKTSFRNIAQFEGAIEYIQDTTRLPIVIGLLQGFVQNKGDAFEYTLNSLKKYYKTKSIDTNYLKMIQLLAKRTAEMHLALYSEKNNPSFKPEPFTLKYQHTLFRSMQKLTKTVFGLLQKNQKKLPKKLAIESILKFEYMILKKFKTLAETKISTEKMRIHGDYHLEQVLFTGTDFFVIDFEGEPMRPLNARRAKKSPLVDVAGMLRSFHYASYIQLMKSSTNWQKNKNWADVWYKCVSETFLKSYFETVKSAPFIPKDKHQRDILLNIFLLEKAVYELGYELNNRPDWLTIPINGIKNLLNLEMI
ncbi:MAG: putative maltokinase [Elusimicrobiota bacterium]